MANPAQPNIVPYVPRAGPMANNQPAMPNHRSPAPRANPIPPPGYQVPTYLQTHPYFYAPPPHLAVYQAAGVPLGQLGYLRTQQPLLQQHRQSQMPAGESAEDEPEPESTSQFIKQIPSTERNCPSLAYRPLPGSLGYLPSDIIRVTVGDTQSKTFNVYRGILMGCSKYFEKALQGTWAEAEDRHITLKDEDPDIFLLFLNFAVTGKLYGEQPSLDVAYLNSSDTAEPVKLITTDDGLTAESSKEDPTQVPLSFPQLGDLYAFADRRIVPALMDMVVSLTLEKIATEGKIPIDMIQHSLNSTSRGARDRLFYMLASVAARFVTMDDMMTHLEDLPKEFLFLAMRRKQELLAHKNDALRGCKQLLSAPPYRLDHDQLHSRVVQGLELMIDACIWHLHDN